MEKKYPREPPEWMKDYPVLLKLYEEEGASFQKDLDKLVSDTARNAWHSAVRNNDPLDPFNFGWG